MAELHRLCKRLIVLISIAALFYLFVFITPRQPLRPSLNVDDPKLALIRRAMLEAELDEEQLTRSATTTVSKTVQTNAPSTSAPSTLPVVYAYFEAEVLTMLIPQTNLPNVTINCQSLNDSSAALIDEELISCQFTSEFTVQCEPKSYKPFVKCIANVSESAVVESAVISIEPPTNGTWKNYAICIEPLTGTEPNWYLLLQQIETSRQLGAQHIFVYIHELNDYASRDLLAMYEMSAITTVIELPPSVSFASDCWKRYDCRRRFAAQDCLHRTRDRYHYVLFTPLDALLYVPERNTTIPQTLEAYDTENMVLFTLKSHVFERIDDGRPPWSLYEATDKELQHELHNELPVLISERSFGEDGELNEYG